MGIRERDGNNLGARMIDNCIDESDTVSGGDGSSNNSNLP